MALFSYFSGRFLVDFLQIPLEELASLMNTSQWLSLPFIVIGAAILGYSLRRHHLAGFRMLEETPEGAPQEDDAPSNAT